MIRDTKRAAIRRAYRMLRMAVDKTQIDVESSARLDAGRFWKIENGVVCPTAAERARIAKVLKVPVTDIPGDDTVCSQPSEDTKI